MHGAGTAVALVAALGLAAPADRPAAVAGVFYPREARALEEGVRAFLAEALPPDGERPLGLLVPHAGHIYSGQIAADAWRQATAHAYDLIVILGTNHAAPPSDGVSVYDGAGYRTPLGLAEIDRQVVAALLAADSDFTFDPALHEREHSVEVQVPFVQVAFPGVRIVAAVIGRPDPELCSRFGRKLAAVVAKRRVLIVASSDLSHYPAHDDAARVDLETLEAAARLDAAAFHLAVGGGRRTAPPGLATFACGEGPILAAIEAVRALGATRGRIVSHASSGDTVLGDRSRVVGYGALAWDAGSPEREVAPAWRPEVGPAGAPLSSQEGAALLAFARRTIERFMTTGTAPLARGLPLALSRPQGAFVTLEKRGELRGCMGDRQGGRPLCQVVGAMALQAAFHDVRFPSLLPRELPEVRIEISLLGEMQPVSDVRSIRLGVDGVLLLKDGHRAVFLPEVAAERGWSREQLLDELCAKAGLGPGSWRRGAEIFTFRTEVLREPEPG